MQAQDATWRRFWETLRHLEPEQILYQIWRPLQPWVWPRPKRHPEDVEPRAGWGLHTHRPHRPADAAVLEGRFRFWGVERRLDLQREWRAPDLGSSWNFPVHYFDDVAALAASGGRTPERDTALRDHLLQWMQAHDIERGEPWHPYTTSLRVVNWLEAIAILQEGAEPVWTREVLRSIYRQVDSIPPRLERHLLGTHLLKNLKAILIGTSVFQDHAMRRHRARALGLLSRELRAQVQIDGGHLEPSAMYHCMATGDLLDLLNFRGALPEEAVAPVRRVAQEMLAYAVAIQTPDGGYPLQGDAWREGEWTPRQLGDYATRLGLDVPRPADGLTFLPSSGVAVWRGGRSWLFADVAPIGPPHLPGHGHCDSLSFEWSVDGVALVVDAGTFTYEDGAQRQACRSTSAHNTLQLDGEELHEVWSRFRVGRRSGVEARRPAGDQVEACLRPWFAPGVLMRRRFRFAADALHIEDAVEGPGDHAITSRVHLHSDCVVRHEGEGVVSLQRAGVRARLRWEGGRVRVLSSETSGSQHAEHAGCTAANAVVVLEHHGPLPFRSRMVLDAV